MIERLFDVTVSDKYDTLATVAFLTVLFYGAGLAFDVAKRAFTDSLPRQRLNELIEVLATETGKPAADIRKTVEARFQKPAAAKRVVRSARKFFLPSQRNGNAPVVLDRDRIITGLSEAMEHAQGQRRATEHDVAVHKIDVRAVRESLKMSQEEFALQFGFSLGTLRGWEQGRRQPDGTARVLLKVIMSDPNAVKKALAAA